jgi:hypothetical protein
MPGRLAMRGQQCRQATGIPTVRSQNSFRSSRGDRRQFTRPIHRLQRLFQSIKEIYKGWFKPRENTHRVAFTH